MVIYVDIDNTICKTQGCDYENAIPIKRKINKVNKLFKKGHRIVYWTARGFTQSDRAKKRIRDITLAQFVKWNVLFDEIKFDKPVYDIFYEDRSKHL